MLRHLISCEVAQSMSPREKLHVTVINVVCCHLSEVWGVASMLLSISHVAKTVCLACQSRPLASMPLLFITNSDFMSRRHWQRQRGNDICREASGESEWQELWEKRTWLWILPSYLAMPLWSVARIMKILELPSRKGYHCSVRSLSNPITLIKASRSERCELRDHQM